MPTLHRALRAVFLCLAFIGLSTAYAEAPDSSDSLTQAVQDALATQPEVQDSWHEFLAAQDDRRRAFGEYLPSLDLEASAGRRDREYDGWGQHTQQSAQISLTQVLFEGFRVRSMLERADHTVMQRYYELLDVAEQVAVDTAAAYQDVQRYRQLVKLAKTNVQNHQRVYDQIELRERRGVSNKADLQQINGRLALAQTNLLTEVANLHDVSTRFQRLTGRAPMQQMQPAGSTALDNEANIQAILLQTYAGNPGLFARFEAIEGARAKVKESRSGLFPKLEFGVRHGVFQNENGFAERADGRTSGTETVAELRLRYNLFRGGQDRAAMRADAHRVERTQDLRDKACIDLRQTTTIAHNNVMNLEARLQQLKTHRDSAAKVVKAYRKQFDIGRRSLLDVLDSENEAFQAERAYVHGRTDQAIARYRILGDQGAMMRSLSLAPESFPSLDELGGRPLNDSARQYCKRFAAMNWDRSQVADTHTREGGELVVLQSSALFNLGSAKVLPAAAKQLTEFAQELNQDGDVQELDIVGHTDSAGAAEYNRVLSLRRAQSVKEFLIDAGLAHAVITTDGKGEDKPVQNNATAQGRAANRRVEIRVIRRQ